VCRLLEVSTSGYYAWLKRPPSERSRLDAELSKRILLIHLRSRGNYGAPRIHAELTDEGVRVGRERVARLMKAAQLQGISRHKRPRPTMREPAARLAPNLVERDFAVAGPNRLWVADITYIANLGRVVVSRRRRRRLEPSGGGLGDGLSSAHRTGPGCPGNGHPAAASDGGDPPLRPGQPIHLDRLRETLPGGRRPPFHGIGR